MLISKQIKPLTLTLTVETPVAIGADRAKMLSPYSDYVVQEDGSALHYIDQRQLQEILGENQENCGRYLSKGCGIR